MSDSPPINLVTQLNLHCFQLRMLFNWILLKGEATALILLYQSAAFDPIDQDTLLDSLSSWFSVSGVVLDSYISDHIQCIKIGSILSNAKKLLYGVAPGSVLGPILFSLYTTPVSKSY